MDDNKNTFAYKFGRFVGFVLAVCAASWVVGLAIAATIKFYALIF